jgi:hypothetical protein
LSLSRTFYERGNQLIDLVGGFDLSEVPGVRDDGSLARSVSQGIDIKIQ